MSKALDDFTNFAIHHMGISGMQLHYWNKTQEKLYDPRMSMTPYIIEEIDRRGVQMDIFSRMMIDRILWTVGVVNDNMSTVVNAQLMWLNQQDPTLDILMYIDSPGGSVKSGLSMIDVMNYVDCDISTVNIGMAASMGSILLGGGTKGKRHSLPHSKVMLHQVSSGAQGNVNDMKISLDEAIKYNDELFTLLGDFTGKKPEVVKVDADRDFWMTADEAVKYGIIDSVITRK